jgi:hypothetical protein
MVLSGLLSTLSLYAKQTNVFLVAALCLFSIWRDGKRAVFLIATLGVTSAGTFAWLAWRTDGAFAGWLFNTVHHALEPSAPAKYLGRLLAHAPFLFFVPFLVQRVSARGGLSPSSRLWLGTLLAAVPASLLPYVKVEGADNALMPLLFLAGPVTLMVAGDALSRGLSGGRDGAVPSHGPGASRLAWIGLIVQALICVQHLYDPRLGRPSPEARQRAESLNREIAGLRGGVVCPLDSFLPAVNGHHTEQAHWLSHADAMLARRAGVTVASYTSWLTETLPRWVVLAGAPEEAAILQAIAARYALVAELPVPAGPRWLRYPVPHQLYERCDAQEAGCHGPCKGRAEPPAE